MASTRTNTSATRSNSGRGRPTGRRPSSRGGRIWWALAGTVALLVAVVAVSAQGGNDQPTAAGSAEPTTRVVLASAGGEAVGDDAPAFEVRTTAGSSFELPAGKPAVLFFMAGWCATCIPEAKALESIKQDLGDGVAILAVSSDPTDSLTAISAFAEEAGASYGFIHDSDGTLGQALGVRALDTTVVIDADGQIVWRDSVPSSETAIRDALAQAGAA